MTDDELLSAIRREIAASPFVGEGHKKITARLRHSGIHTSRKRVLRLTREAGLLAPTPQVRKRSKRLHDRRITVEVPDTLWATDATEAHTRQDGRCAVFAIVELRARIRQFARDFNDHWLLERHDYRTPAQARQTLRQIAMT